MPELPEVTTVIGILKNEIIGKTIDNIEVLYRNIIESEELIMHHAMCPGYNQPQTTFDNLMDELQSIEANVRAIKEMDVPGEAKSTILVALQQQINEVKERMHDYIDTL